MGNTGFSPLSFLRNIYSLDTLDTRFTTSSTTPYRTVIESRNEKKESPKPQPDPNAGPPRWKTPEFILYYACLSFVIPYMFWVAYDVSRPSHPQYYKFENLLWPGWIPGRKIDVSDPQYRVFRWNLPYMFALLTLHPLLRRLWNIVIHPLPASLTLSPSSRGSSPNVSRSPAGFGRASAEEVGAARLKQRISFDFFFAIMFLFILHGFSGLKVLLILWTNYQLCMRLPKKNIPVATWIFNVGILFANELCHGYPFAGIARLVSPAVSVGDLSAEEGLMVVWGKWLDAHSGIMPRWQILFNITILRLVSFNMDYYWSLDRRAGSPVEKQLDPACLSERDRVSIPALPHEFNFRSYLAHAIYAPLYLAGPILTFNDYIAQCKHRPLTIETRRTFLYGVRFLLTLLAMEIILHYDYVVAISKARPNWGDYSAAELSLLSYFNLHIIWLKLLLPFRLFRLWSLIDGIDPPENMIRCVSDNYSTLMFWRSWHRSYNRWLLRYIYIPLGGVNFRTPIQIARSILTYVLVFTFVALWHDIQLRLLVWGWLIVLFLLPEIAASYFFPQRKWERWPTAYRMISCAGAVGNVFMMVTANLVGFAVGLDGLQSIIHGIMADYYGVLFLVCACGAFFMAIQIMFEIRQQERRNGIVIKC